MTLREEIIQKAMALAPEDRAYVADLLEGSLPAQGFASKELAASWSAEIDRRIARFDREDCSPMVVDRAMPLIQPALSCHHAE